jgi:Cu(I)/Ag(I) efflux system membrane fusion protein
MNDQKESGLMQQIWNRHWRKLIVAEVLLVFVLGYMTRGDSSPIARVASKDDAPAKEAAKPLFWTCSMHPEVELPNNKKKCPKCQMALIRVTSHSAIKKTGLRQLTISTAARELMQIKTSRVERRFVAAEIRMSGKVDYDETRLKHVTARVPGRLDRLFVDYTGVQVKEGDHLVSIYSEQLYTAQQELIAAVKSKTSGQPRSNFFDAGVDLVESSREKLRLLGVTEQQVAAIEKQSKPSDHMTFYSPIAGIVVEKMKQEGDRVDVGDRIYTVADLSHLWVKLDAYESDLQWVRYGQKITFTTAAYPGEIFDGQIAFIDRVLTAQTRTVKVRVNVPNPSGKLKPEMFVRAIVHSRVASGGRVMDAALAGKWISPMHPEIVKDVPGNCDICNMPLVRAESLGYVAAEEGDLSKPLVVPVSATLITGTRAIVYVEDTKAKEPTFHGREIVLGPRAGKYYLVLNGLKEGEVVVTNGNFKIDSALQIQAQPSMMTPGRDRDNLAETKTKLPVGFEDGLYRLVAGFGTLEKTLNEKDIEPTKSGFAEFNEILQGIDASLLKDHPKMIWDELSMLISNDAVEGQNIKRLEDAVPIAASLTRLMQRLQTQMGIKPSRRKRYNVPSEFREQLAQVWGAYQSLAEALAQDDLPKSRIGVDELQASLKSTDATLLNDPETRNGWMAEQRNLTKIVADLKTSRDIKTVRENFAPLSGQMFVIVRSFGVGENVSVYQHYCAMAFNKRGAAWLQADEEVRNPYFGSTMLRCAEHSELIVGERTNP